MIVSISRMRCRVKLELSHFCDIPYKQCVLGCGEKLKSVRSWDFVSDGYFSTPPTITIFITFFVR